MTRFRILVVPLVVAVLAPLAALVALAPPASAATQCDWRNKGETTMYRACANINYYRIAGWATNGESVYSPPMGRKGHSTVFDPSAHVIVKLKDKAADGSCVWLARRMTGVPWGYDYDPDTTTKVCGKGESRLVSIHFGAQQIQQGSTVYVLFCTESYCASFWSQRVTRKNFS